MADFLNNETNNTTANTSALIKRGFMALEDKDWVKADGFFEQALNINAELAEAYLGKLLAELKLSKKDALLNCSASFDTNGNYQKAIRFGTDELKAELSEYCLHAKEKSEAIRCENLYNLAVNNMNNGRFEDAINNLRPISNYKDASALATECTRLIEESRKEGVYISACNMLTNAKTGDDVMRAKDLFNSIVDYKDAASKSMECSSIAIEVEQAEKENKEKQSKRNKKIKICSIIGIVAIVILGLIFVPRALTYNKAEQLFKDDKLAKAYELYIKTPNYKRSEDRIRDILDAYSGKTIAAGGLHTVAVREDGTVVATGDKYSYSSGYYSNHSSVGDWTDIEAVAAGYSHTVGLKSNGYVVAEGNNNNGQCDVDYWYDIEAIAAGAYHTVGLKSDGTVVATGSNANGACNVSDWEDIVAISAGVNITIGLKEDGTVVATDNSDPCKYWEDVVAITASFGYSRGIQKDGTVLDMSAYADKDDVIIAISGDAALTSDGKVKGTGTITEDWDDVIGISKYYHTVALKEDGTVVAAGSNNDYGELNVSSWRDIKVPEAFK